MARSGSGPRRPGITPSPQTSLRTCDVNETIGRRLMSDDLQNFDGIARLFPLPNLVLFPFVIQPLHIFEERYRRMTADALAGDRLIGMVLLRPGFEAEYAGRPAIHSVACLGRIVADKRLEDGRYNLLLRGLARVRIAAEIDSD